MSRRDSIETRILDYFHTVNEDVGKTVYKLVQAVARKRGLAGRAKRKVAEKLTNQTLVEK